MAVESGKKEIVEVLLRAGADRNCQNIFGYTPLHKAAAKGHKEIAEILLLAGADKNCKSSGDETPDYVKTILAEVECIVGGAINLSGGTPLHLAVEGGQKEMVGILLRAGADITVQTDEGLTASDIAVKIGNHEIVRLIKQVALQRACAFLSGFQERFGAQSPVQAIGDIRLAEFIIRLALGTSGKTQPELP